LSDIFFPLPVEPGGAFFVDLPLRHGLNLEYCFGGIVMGGGSVSKQKPLVARPVAGRVLMDETLF
jgi:hypothetical protein